LSDHLIYGKPAQHRHAHLLANGGEFLGGHLSGGVKAQ
jgi:hypothetical protein